MPFGRAHEVRQVPVPSSSYSKRNAFDKVYRSKTKWTALLTSVVYKMKRTKLTTKNNNNSLSTIHFYIYVFFLY